MLLGLSTRLFVPMSCKAGVFGIAYMKTAIPFTNFGSPSGASFQIPMHRQLWKKSFKTYIQEYSMFGDLLEVVFNRRFMATTLLSQCHIRQPETETR